MGMSNHHSQPCLLFWIKELSCIFAILFILPNLYAQPKNLQYTQGAIFLDGAKKEGWIAEMSHTSATQFCYFKPTENGKVIRYTPEDISKYELYGKRSFRRAEINTQKSTEQVFLEYIIQGSHSMLMYKQKNFLEHEGQVSELKKEGDISMVDGEPTSNPKSTYIHVLRQAMVSSCMQIDDALRGLNLSFASLQDLFVQYYACVKQPYTQWNKQLHKIKLQHSIVGIMRGTQVDLTSSGLVSERYLNPDHFSFSMSPHFSYLLDISAPNFSDRVSMRTGLGISFLTNSYQSSVEDFDIVFSADYSMELITLEVPLLCKINLIHGKVPLYVLTGLQSSIPISTEITLQSMSVPGNSQVATYNPTTRDYIFAIPIIFEAEIPIQGKKILLDLGFQRSTNFFSSGPNKPIGFLNQVLIGGGFAF